MREPDWLDALPRLVAECAEQWYSSSKQPIDTPHSLVIPAGEVVLKLNAPSISRRITRPTRSRSGAATERYGCTPVTTHAALLLERCIPGAQLGRRHRRGPSSPSSFAGASQATSIDAHPFTHLAASPTDGREEVPKAVARGGARSNAGCSTSQLDVYRTVEQRPSPARSTEDLHGGNVLAASTRAVARDRPEPSSASGTLELALLRNADS